MVVALYGDKDNSDAWYRAQIITSGDREVLVKFIDYGTTATISDGRKIKKIPASCVNLPVLAIKLELPVERLEDEEISLTLMLEELFTEERSIVVRISSVEEEGTLRGHLEVQNTGEMVYRNLIKEGIIKSLL